MTTERHLDDEERTDPTGADGLAIEHARAHYTHLSRALYVCSTDLWTGSVGEDVQRLGEHLLLNGGVLVAEALATINNCSTALRSVRTPQTVTNFCDAQQEAGPGSQPLW